MFELVKLLLVFLLILLLIKKKVSLGPSILLGGFFLSLLFGLPILQMFITPSIVNALKSQRGSPWKPPSSGPPETLPLFIVLAQRYR